MPQRLLEPEPVLAGEEGDRFVGVPDLVLRQDRLVGLDDRDGVDRDVVGGDDGDPAPVERGVEVDAEEAAAGDVAPDGRAVEHSGQDEVVDVTRRAGRLGGAVDAGNGLSDRGRHRASLPAQGRAVSCRSAVEDLPEGRLEAGEPEPEAEGHGLRGKDLLPVEDQRGHLSHRGADREGGGRREGGAVEDPAERRGERLHRDGRGGRGVDRAVEAGVLERRDEEGDEVVAVDPRHPLLPAAERAADAEPEGEEHLRKRPAPLAEDDPDPRADETDPSGRGAPGRVLPGHRRLGEKAGAGPARLGQLLVPAVPVEADGRSVDEHAGPPLRGPERRADLFGGPGPAPDDPGLRGRGPALGDRLPGEIDDGVGAVDGGRQVAPGDGAGARGDPVVRGVPRDDHDVSSPSAEGGDESAPEESGPAGDDDHRYPVPSALPAADSFDRPVAVGLDARPVEPVLLFGLLPLGGLEDLPQGVLEEDLPLGEAGGADGPRLGDGGFLGVGEVCLLDAGLGVGRVEAFHGEIEGGLWCIRHGGIVTSHRCVEVTWRFFRAFSWHSSSRALPARSPRIAAPGRRPSRSPPKS